MGGHHGRHQLVRDGPGAERALHAHGHQRRDGQRGRTAQFAAIAPRHRWIISIQALDIVTGPKGIAWDAWWMSPCAPSGVTLP
ncbi:hypothetical protein G6F68_020361 [Rhizopus microsporus]|nr:hypothetical protein G6F24_018662 [Rhizopus arrhizus]KAG1223369.1 hypothetical protein G6F68_020361 [Rhizopus microsporus]